MSFKLDTNDDEVNIIVEDIRFVLIPTSNSAYIVSMNDFSVQWSFDNSA